MYVIYKIIPLVLVQLLIDFVQLSQYSAVFLYFPIKSGVNNGYCKFLILIIIIHF